MFRKAMLELRGAGWCLTDVQKSHARIEGGRLGHCPWNSVGKLNMKITAFWNVRLVV
jgi:hypothetical protein